MQINCHHEIPTHTNLASRHSGVRLLQTLRDETSGGGVLVSAGATGANKAALARDTMFAAVIPAALLRGLALFAVCTTRLLSVPLHLPTLRSAAEGRQRLTHLATAVTGGNVFAVGQKLSKIKSCCRHPNHI
jgi:hypothetical protein